MSVFNRKLFTRTPYDHYGTGIASGLVERQGFAVGGRVNYAKGGDSSGFDYGQAVKQNEAEEAKKELFKGNELVTGGLGLSVIGKAYQITFNKLLKETNITKEQFENLTPEDQRRLGDDINDRVVVDLMSRFNVGADDIEKAFGGKAGEKGVQKMSDGAMRAISGSFSNKFNEEENPYLNNQQVKLDEELEKINQEYPQATQPLPNVQEYAPETDAGNAELDPEITPPSNMNQGLGDKSLMGMDRTTDEFRQGYMDNLREAQDELGLADKRRQQMRSQSLINMGAADPVQKGESFMQMAAKSFADPMKELYAAENLRDEDIYKRYGDRTDAAYDPNEKAAAQVQLADYFIGKGIPEQEVLAIMTGSSDREMDLLNNPVVIEAMGEYMSNNPTASILDAKNNVLRGMIPSNITDNTITNPIITAPTNSVLANGGRVGLNQGGRVGLNLGGTPSLQQNMQQPLQSSMQQSAPEQSEQMTFQELREQLPDYINDDVVRLLVQSPEALLDLSEAKTADDLDRFEQKYNVQVTMPAAENEATTDGML